jgi:hypothetical protein
MPTRKMVKILIEEKFGRYKISGRVGSNGILYDVEPLNDTYIIDCKTTESVLSDHEIFTIINLYHELENRIN